jgi:acyl-CoA thioesterase FadM
METPRVPESSALRTHVRLATRWSDEDNQAVLNNAAYLTLFEEARHRYFAALGLLEGNRFPFLLAQTNVRFLQPGRGGAEVVVELGTTHVGTSSLVQAYRVREVASGAAWCEAEALLVGWSGAARAKAPWSARFAAAVRAHEGLDAGAGAGGEKRRT